MTEEMYSSTYIRKLDLKNCKLVTTKKFLTIDSKTIFLVTFKHKTSLIFQQPVRTQAFSPWEKLQVEAACPWSFLNLRLCGRGELLLLVLSFGRKLCCHRTQLIRNFSEAWSFWWLCWPTFLHQWSPIWVTRFWYRWSQCVAHNTPWIVIATIISISNSDSTKREDNQISMWLNTSWRLPMIAP